MGFYQIIIAIIIGIILLASAAWAVIYILFYAEKTEKIYITALRTEADTYIAEYYVKQKKKRKAPLKR